jgi:hypothetical protein
LLEQDIQVVEMRAFAGVFAVVVVVVVVVAAVVDSEAA